MDHKELPLRSKQELAKGVIRVLHHLQAGEFLAIDPLLEELKARSLRLSTEIQRGLLIFAEQVQFQREYDLRHCLTSGIQKAADALLEDLGISLRDFEK